MGMGMGGGVLSGLMPQNKMVPDGKGGYINANDVGAMNPDKPQATYNDPRPAPKMYEGPEFSQATSNGSGVNYYDKNAPSSAGAPPGTPVPGSGGGGGPLGGLGSAGGAGGSASATANADFSSLLQMNADQTAPSFLTGELAGMRPNLGQRQPPSMQSALAGLSRAY